LLAGWKTNSGPLFASKRPGFTSYRDGLGRERL
jgi:hypothetical protein